LRQSHEVLRRQRVGRRRFRRNVILAEHLASGEMRRDASRLGKTEVDRWLAQIDRTKLPVQIGKMQKRHVSEPREAQQLAFSELLLRDRTLEAAEALRRYDGRRGGAGL